MHVNGIPKAEEERKGKSLTLPPPKKLPRLKEGSKQRLISLHPHFPGDTVFGHNYWGVGRLCY